MGNTIKGKTQSGFSFTVDVRRMRDIRFIELLAESEKGENPTLVLPRLVKMVLGDQQKEKLYKHLEDKDGFVDSTAVEAEMVEVFNIVKEKSEEVKNS